MRNEMGNTVGDMGGVRCGAVRDGMVEEEEEAGNWKESRVLSSKIMTEAVSE